MATKIKPQRIRANNSPTSGQVPTFLDENTFERGEGGGGGGDIVFVSDPIATVTDGTVQTFTHNLNVTQADIEAGRYDISFTFKIPSDKGNIRGTIYGGGSDGTVDHVWSAIDPISREQLHRQANTLKSLANTSGQTFEDVRCIIRDLRLQTGGLGSGAGQTVYISPAQDVIGSNVYTISHDLDVTQADVEAGRYKVMFSYQQTIGAFGYYEPVIRISGVYQTPGRGFRDSVDPTIASDINWQANTLKVMAGDDANNMRLHIIDTRVTNVKAGVEDTAYGPSWDGVTNVAPSKNAVYDKIESMLNTGGYLILAGTNHTFASAPTTRSNTNSTPTKVKEILINSNGQYRFSAYLEGYNPVSNPCVGHAQIYKIGVAYGIEHTIGNANTIFSEDLTFSKTDLCQLYIWVTGSANSTVFTQNVLLKGDHSQIAAELLDGTVNQD